MNCIIKNDMKFGEYFIPAGTEARVINTPKYKEAGVPGLDLYLAISFLDIQLMQRKSVSINEIEIKDELEKNNRDTVMTGITIRTNGTKVLMDAGDEFYAKATISEYQAKKVLGMSEVPNEIRKDEYHANPYYLESIIYYLENEFSKWVKCNCEFYTCTEEDIENDESLRFVEPGTSVLSQKGLKQFESKKIEYQNMLERIGFTYNFKGGLIWE